MIGNKLRRLRRQKRMTQEELTNGFYTRSYLSLIENDKFEPPIEAIQFFAQRLGVSVSDLILDDAYRQKLVCAQQSLTDGIELNDRALIQEAWSTFSQLQSLSDMISSVIAWAKLKNPDQNLIDAINYTDTLITFEDANIKDYWKFRVYAGNSYFYLGQFDQAIGEYRDILGHCKDLQLQMRVRINLGSSYMCTSHYEEASLCFEKALEFDLKDIWKAKAHQGLARCYRYLERRDDAFVQIELANRLFKGLDEQCYMQTLHSLGVLYLDKKEIKEAEKLFEEVYQFYDQHQMTEHMVELIEEFVRLEVYKQEFEEALQWSRMGLMLLKGHNGHLAGRFFAWRCLLFKQMDNPQAQFESAMAVQCLLGDDLKITLSLMDPHINLLEMVESVLHPQT